MSEEYKMKKQLQFCIERNLPMFVAKDGICWNMKCKKKIPDTDKEHITGCPFCHDSFCD